MTFMQKLTVWMAKRYLRAHHYRASGYTGDTVLASGDILMSPGAVRLIRIFNASRKTGVSAVIDMDTAPPGSSFVGVDPPKKKVVVSREMGVGGEPVCR